MYCPQCSHYIDDAFPEYSYSTDSDYSLGDEEEMSWDDWDYNAEQMEDFSSTLKRSREELTVPDERPRKRVCRVQDISRSDAPIYTPMNVDE